MHFATDPTPEQLALVTQGSKLSTLEPEMVGFIEKMMAQTQQRMFTALSKAELTPEMALQGWHELHAAYRLLQKYKQTIQVGVSTGTELTLEKRHG